MFKSFLNFFSLMSWLNNAPEQTLNLVLRSKIASSNSFYLMDIDHQIELFYKK